MSKRDLRRRISLLQRRRYLALVLSAVVAVASSLFGASLAQSATGPVLNVSTPSAGQVITDDEFTVVLDVQSRFPVVDLAIKSDAFEERRWFGVDFACSDDGLTCEIWADLPEWEFAYDTEITDGPFSFLVRAYDQYGVAGPAATVSVVMDRYRCGGLIYSPAPGESVTGTVIIKVLPQCPAGGGESWTEIYIDGEYQPTVWGFQGRFELHSWDTRRVENGPHTIAVGGFDGTSHDPPDDTVTVIVDNGPSAQIVFPSTKWVSGQPLTTQQVSLLTLSGHPIPGKTLKLKVDREKGQPLTLNATTNDGGTATFSFPEPIIGPNIMTAIFPGDSTYPAARETLDNIPGWTVRYAVNKTKVRHGQKLTMTVRVRPAEKAQVFIFTEVSTTDSVVLFSGKTNSRGVWRRTVTVDWTGQLAIGAMVQGQRFRSESRSNKVVVTAR